MDAVLHSDPKVQESLKDFVLVKLDADKSPEVKNLRVEGVPLMIFYAPDGREIERQTGFLAAEEIVKLLKRVQEKS